MSRPVKPTNIKILQGTARPGRMNKDEPTPNIEIPEMPTHLTGEAAKEWKFITAHLKSMGLISRCDKAAISFYCTLWKDHVEAEAQIAEKGRVVITPNGSEQISPWVSISKHAMLAAHKMLVEFGLTPASRTKVSAKTPEKKKDPKSRFFQNG
ncbi:MAG: phage terminase small subunit P27 family [Proteobacteria bacterium]|nr:phage terminase small subunit P27 family [Pseudomonadota bacterium]